MFYQDLLMNFFQEIDEENSIVFQKTIPSQKAVYAELSSPLSWRLTEILEKGNLTALYSHQVEAINAIKEGKNVVIATRTSSGKSLCYNVPVIEAIVSDTSIRALYIFPTKALAQNQAKRLDKYNYAFYYGDFNFGIYDGDTPQDVRRKLMKKANILITTPDMLHMGILPNHDKWQIFFQHLRFVVLDELHTYRGIFGTHVAHLIRRLRRICHYYGTEPQFITCSATIAEPLSFAKKLTLLDFELIEQSGAPSGEKTFLFWDPAMKQEEGLRRSMNTEASLLFYHLISSNIRTIVFTRTRSVAEIILKTTRDLLSGSHSSLVERITSYRAGYIPELRRKIEKQLNTGELLGVVTTSALEVGVDIGTLDACVMVGFPGNIMSTWQQAGRVGRRTGASIVVIIATETPHDHYYLHHGEDFFNSCYESCVLDIDNPYILDGHLRCAAYELPFEEHDESYFGKLLLPFVRAYNEKNYLFYKENKFYWNIEDYYPAKDFSLRTGGGELYQIVNSSPPCNILGTTPGRNVKFYFHPGAIYIHQGENYKVLELDERKKKIYVIPDPVEYYTLPQIISEVEPVKPAEKKSYLREFYLGPLRIKEKCVSYREIEILTGKYLKTVPLNIEDNLMDTCGFWFAISEEIQKILRTTGIDLSGSLHGAGNSLTFIIPLFTLCNTGDIGIIVNLFHPATGKPTIFIYDRFPGGIGYSYKGCELFPSLIEKSFEMIMRCRCENGCPRCMYSSKSPYPQNYLNKTGALLILEGLMAEIRDCSGEVKRDT
ncbi:MAG TPA: DEAD/DEAH box helicase [Candidatus Eremiobacteraeota bacterium]|nr:MAG: ATP-dependent RNA helicase RhlE [bacterium ADurb.Bin363]HPZ07800.1 DEAD/DEAH box helicase [Candidatus Eremiobacteraeota bacterium]